MTELSDTDLDGDGDRIPPALVELGAQYLAAHDASQYPEIDARDHALVENIMRMALKLPLTDANDQDLWREMRRLLQERGFLRDRDPALYSLWRALGEEG